MQDDSTRQEIDEVTDITINISELEQQIKLKGEYIQDNLLCRTNKTAQSQDVNYFLKVETNFKFIGFISNRFLRQYYGYNQYANGDIYLGSWKDGDKHGDGLYIHSNENKEYKIYSGQWSQGHRKGSGIYIWKCSSTLESNLKERVYDAFIGSFDESNYSYGLYISKTSKNKESKNYAYKGRFVNGKKQDDKALYYQFHDRVCVYGQFHEDYLNSGTVVSWDEHDKIIEMFDFYIEDFNVKKKARYIYDDDIEDKDIKYKICLNFKDYLTKSDWFDTIASHHDELLKLVEESRSLDNFDVDMIKKLNSVLPRYKEFNRKLN